MSTFEHFIPSVEHPWTPSVIRLVCGEILGQSLEVQRDVAYCLNEHITIAGDYYGLAEESNLVAVAALGFQDKKVGVIDYLAVQPEEQGKGYGRQLLEELEAVARTAGAISIRTQPIDINSKYFFAHHGYRHQPIKGKSTESWLKDLT
jgi:N-acetylglutamate synthase-like GNAT family acetyltransferase